MIVDLEFRGHVAILWMNDHAKRNALSEKLLVGMLEAVTHSRDFGARALVIASRSTVFCAGADLSNIRSAVTAPGDHGTSPKPAAASPYDLFQTLLEEPRPVIAAVGGAAAGGGFELTLCCDLAVAATGAFFVLPEIGHGLIPNTAMWRLPHIVGQRNALDLMLTRRRLPAAEAKSLGLVNRVVDESDTVNGAVEMALQIVADAPPRAIELVKRRTAPSESERWSEIRSVGKQLDPQEVQAGIAAFVAKQKPDYAPFWQSVLKRQ